MKHFNYPGINEMLRCKKSPMPKSSRRNSLVRRFPLMQLLLCKNFFRKWSTRPFAKSTKCTNLSCMKHCTPKEIGKKLFKSQASYNCENGGVHPPLSSIGVFSSVVPDEKDFFFTQQENALFVLHISA